MRLAPVLLLALAGCAPRTPPEPAAPAVAEATGPTIAKSPLDERDYAFVELDNGMRALLISDPDTDMAAAALTVHVGHYVDPVDRQGLAHFLEHMLFLGTDRYPVVDEYRKFVKDHGGRTNAGTGGETTSYHFQIEHGYLEPAFDRFSRFFVAPSLDPAYVERERGAVDAEYSLKIKDHAGRIRQVRKVTTNPDHPESKFSVGNHDTLGDGEVPVHEDLLALYESAYRPDQMTVAVLGREPVETLRSWVVERLGEVAGQPADEAERPPPFTSEQLGVRIDMVPLDERRELELQFPLPPQRELWPHRPHGYLASVLGHEGEGTLFAGLKERGWIEALVAGNADGADDYDLFRLQLDLTRQGAQHIDEIVATCFAAIERVKADGIDAFRQEEAERLAQLRFAFSGELQPRSAVTWGAWSLAYHEPEHVLDHYAVYEDFRPELVRQALDQMTVDNARLLVVLPEGESDALTDRTEPLYDVAYGLRPFTEQERATFTGGTELELSLPGPNPYLPEQTALKPGGEEPGVPVRLSDAGDPVDLWHLHDTSFGVPRAMGTLQLYSPDARAEGLRSHVLSQLFEEILEDDLAEFQYPPKLAGLDFLVDGGSDGLYLRWWGYDDRQEELLRDLARRIRGIEVDPERFALVQEERVRQWRNVASRRPVDQVRWVASESLDPHDWASHDAADMAAGLTAEDLQAFIDGFWDPLSARMLVHGNHTEQDARALAAVVQEELLTDVQSPAGVDAVRRLLPPGTEVVRDVAIDHDDSTLAVRHLSIDDSLASQARWRLLGQLLTTPFFTELRTNQQLGYVVYAGYGSEDRLPSLWMVIQSTAAGPVTLLERVDAFVAEHHQTLQDMPDDEFAAIRAGLAAKLRERETQLYDRTANLRGDLHHGVLTFDEDEQVAALIEGLDKQDMVAMYEEVLLSEQSSRLLVRSFGKAHVDEQEEAEPGCRDEACVAEALTETWRRSLTELSAPGE